MGNARYGAIEAGGTKFICEVTNAEGTPLAATRINTTTPTETMAQVLQFFTAQQQTLGPIDAFGIAAFGPLDVHRCSPTFGHVLATPKPQWSNTDLVTPLRQQFGCTVGIDTDVNAAALAEALHGAAQHCSNVVYVTVGTGIGGGVCIDGNTLKGALHPEMGHIRVLRHERDKDFAGCCPFHGDCLEGLASGPAIAARYGKPLDELADTSEAVEVVGYYLGQLASTCILLLSPQRIVFGGGVMQQAALYPVIRRTALQLINGYVGIGALDTTLEQLIVAPGLGERSGISGAFALARQAQTDDQQLR
jgi:fructokinase